MVQGAVRFSVSDNFQAVGIWQRRDFFCRERLVPICDRSNVILKRKVAPALAPPQGLDGYPQIFIETDGIGNMPAIERKALLRLVKAVRPNDTGKPRIRGTELCIMPLYVKIIGAAEIVLGTGAANGGIVLIPI